MLMVYGLTSAYSAPPSAWQPVVINTRCTNAPPCPPRLLPNASTITGNALNLLFEGNVAGCVTNSVVMEVGTNHLDFTVP